MMGYRFAHNILQLAFVVCKLVVMAHNVSLESRRRRTKGSVVGEEWCQNAAPLR